jgi:hypothetical protein
MPRSARHAASACLDDLQAATRNADRAAAQTHRIIGFEHDHRHAVVRQPERGAQAHGPGADDHDRVPPALGAIRAQFRQARRMVLGFKRIGNEAALHGANCA